MGKRRMKICLLSLVMAAVVAGIFGYISYVNSQNSAKKGTLVRTFLQKEDERFV